MDSLWNLRLSGIPGKIEDMTPKNPLVGMGIDDEPDLDTHKGNLLLPVSRPQTPELLPWPQVHHLRKLHTCSLHDAFSRLLGQ